MGIHLYSPHSLTHYSVPDELPGSQSWFIGSGFGLASGCAPLTFTHHPHPHPHLSPSPLTSHLSPSLSPSPSPPPLTPAGERLRLPFSRWSDPDLDDMVGGEPPRSLTVPHTPHPCRGLLQGCLRGTGILCITQQASLGWTPPPSHAAALTCGPAHTPPLHTLHTPYTRTRYPQNLHGLLPSHATQTLHSRYPNTPPSHTSLLARTVDPRPIVSSLRPSS